MRQPSWSGRCVEGTVAGQVEVPPVPVATVCRGAGGRRPQAGGAALATTCGSMFASLVQSPVRRHNARSADGAGGLSIMSRLRVRLSRRAVTAAVVATMLSLALVVPAFAAAASPGVLPPTAL